MQGLILVIYARRLMEIRFRKTKRCVNHKKNRCELGLTTKKERQKVKGVGQV